MDIPQIDVAEVHARRAAGAVVLDVRTPEEWNEAHLAGSVLVPLSELPERVDDIPRGEGPVYVICRSGGRSQRACEFLTGQGWSVANVSGGILAWIDSAFDVEEGEA